MKILFILGMHRSGTSCLARCLKEMGTNFFIPKCEDGYFPKHIEYFQINQLNDAILTSWKNPIVKKNFLFVKYHEWKVGRFLQKNIFSDTIVGIKDPRILLCFNYWAEHIQQFKIISIFRRPEEVALSLEVRDEYGKTSFQKALQLWSLYNEQLVILHDRYQFPLLDFNLNKNDFGLCLSRACTELQIPFKVDVFNDIFLEKKRHHSSDNIPKDCRSIYKSLKKRSMLIEY